MLYRIEAGLFPHLDDTIGRKTAASIREALGIPVKSVRTIKVFTLEGLDAQQVNTLMAKSVLHDPVLQAVSLSPLPLPEEGTSWIIEVGYRPGVTDNEGRTPAIPPRSCSASKTAAASPYTHPSSTASTAR